jgi:formylglycine-generating enzyme required for sulfatase activity
MSAHIPHPDHIVTLPGGVTMAFRPIPAGEFVMGSRGQFNREEPPHIVRIARPFYMGRWPVTQEQFAVWTVAEGIEHQNHFGGRRDHPAEHMDWYQAAAFCEWLSRHAPGLPIGHVAALPTEAEWEYGCRAGTDTEYSSGDGEAALREVAWFGEDFAKGSTHPVGSKAANAFGLHDMHGNVWEWCWDVYDPDAYKARVDGATDPGASARWQDLNGKRQSAEHKGNPDRVLRGGSWDDTAGSEPGHVPAAARPQGTGLTRPGAHSTL